MLHINIIIYFGVLDLKSKKAIIPAAWSGNKILPATKSDAERNVTNQVDKPTIQYIIEEAIESGIEDIIVVTEKENVPLKIISSFFELEQGLLEKGKHEMLEKVQASSKINIHYIRQKEPKGLGIVWCARKFIEMKPFAVLLGDDIVQAETPCLRQLMEINTKEHNHPLLVYKQYLKMKHIVTVLSIQLSKTIVVIKYVNLLKSQFAEQHHQILAIMGRYVLTPEIFMFLENQQTGAGGEIQLTDAIQRLNEIQRVFA